MDLGRSEILGRQVFECLSHDIELIGRKAPAQPGAPDRDVLRQAHEAGIEPPPGLVIRTGPDRQVRSTQPDPIVAGGQAGGGFEIGTRVLHRVGLESELDMHPDQVDGRLRRPFCRFVQVFPTLFDEPFRFVKAAKLAVNRHEQEARVGSVISRIRGGGLDDLFGDGELPLVVCKTHSSQDRLVRKHGSRLDPRQGSRGRFASPPFLFATGQEDRGLVAIGPACQELRQASRGSPEPAVRHLQFDLHDRVAIIPVRPPGPASPGESCGQEYRRPSAPSAHGQTSRFSLNDLGHPVTSLRAGEESNDRADLPEE